MGKLIKRKVRQISIFIICVVFFSVISGVILSAQAEHAREDAQIHAEQIKLYMHTVLEREISIVDVMESWLMTLGEDEMHRIQEAEGGEFDALYEHMASHLYQADIMRALELQPDGVNRYVYPKEGNEMAVGLDVFDISNSEQRRKDAEKSKASGETLITGPINLVRGGEALLVRNPIYYENGDFWGFAIVLLDVPGIFESFGLDGLESDNYNYEFYCYHDDGERHLISKYGDRELQKPVMKMLQVRDKQWELLITPAGGWVPVHVYLSTVLSIVVLSCIVVWVTEKLRDYRQNALESMQKEIEAETRTTIVEEQKKRLETYDELTGCLNFHGFQVTARRVIQECPQKRYAVCYFDIKQFKVFNEKFGYEKGDEVLKLIARQLKNILRESEIVARISGDIFVVLVHYDEMETMGDRFEVIKKNVEEYMDIHMSGFNLVLHAGIYLLEPDDTRNPDINRMVDNANYAQKTIRGQSATKLVVYTGEYRKAQSRKVTIIKSLTKAIKDGELSVWLQPQVNHDTGYIIGAEALCRWNHSTLGNISPGEFMPLLEESGQITELDMFVWERACQLMKKWDDEGKTISLSVNVSRNDILHEGIDQYMIELVQKYGLQPGRLKLEITETAYTENSKELLEVVTKLRQMGFIIEMDDFGTGYSSLNMLKEIPVDVVKLDMRFLSDGGDIYRGKKIVSAILQLARSIEAAVIAEGVENEEQAQYLNGIGCVLMQGYYFSKPLPVEEFEALMLKHKISADSNKFFVLDQIEWEVLENNEFLPVGIIKYKADDEQKLRYVSSSLLRMLGYTRKQFVEKFKNRFSNLIYVEDRERVLSEVDRQISEEKYDYCEYRIEAANGELIWVADRGHLVVDDFGTPCFYVAIVRMDPTGRQTV